MNRCLQFGSWALVVCLPYIVRAADLRPLLKEYCVQCHNAEKLKGDLDLSAFGETDRISDQYDLWQTVLQQVESEEMPPKEPLPSAATRAEFVVLLRQGIDSIDWSQHRGIEHLTLPRLTKLEYGNTLQELLGIDFQAEKRLLDDGQGLSGFTNDRDALFISPALAEQLFDAADYALGALLALKQEPMLKVYEAEEMLMTERGSKPEDLPGGGKGYSLAGGGQRTIYDELIAPEDGWYRLTVRSVGIRGDSGMRLRIDDERRADFECADEQPTEQSVELLLREGIHQMTWNIEIPKALKLESYMAKPVVNGKTSESEKPDVKKAEAKKPTKKQKSPPLPSNAAEIVKAAAETNAPQFPVADDASEKTRNIAQRLNRSYVAMQMRIEYLRLVTPQGSPSELKKYYNLLPERTASMVAIKSELAAELSVPEAEIDRRLIAANPEKIASNQQVLAESLPVIGLEYDAAALLAEKVQRIGSPGVDWIRFEGPIEPAGSQARAIFKDNAKRALTEFLPRVFRRPLRTGELQRYVKLYRSSLAREESHEQALKLAFVAALTSPSFLFRDELQGGELDDHQLASRLSYFLWMSMPDDELRLLADQSKLREEATLRGQVARMLADPKSRVFVSAFLGEWLAFAGIGSEHVPDAKKFDAFTPTLAEAMKLEPVLVFEDLLRNGGSVTRLLDSQQTFVNAELAALYDIPDVAGAEQRRVTLQGDSRAGLLGMAAILTTSATPNRTSPVTRGKWVLENLLGRRLAEPPADAGQLDDKAGERGLTVREELAEHRRHESCAGCHDKIDPIGFGLENFDAIGRFRDEEAGKPVDASGILPGGQEFTGPAELRGLLISRYQDEFVTNFVRQLTSFALGRALNPSDEGLIRRLLEASKSSGHRADKLIESIVLSDAFRTQGTAK